MKKLFLTFLAFLIITPTALAGYSDVPVSHEHSQGVTYLELSGAVDDGKYFNPDETLNRAELFKILFEIFGEDPESVILSSTFTDVPADAWFAPYAELAFKYGLISAKDNLFHPSKTVRLIDAIQILLQAYGTGTSIIPQSERSALFQDVSANHPFYTAIYQTIELGVLTPDTSSTLKPYSALTRGKFAELVMSFDQWNLVNLAEEEEVFYKSDILADIWSRILEDYYVPTGQMIDEEALFQAAVKGMLSSLNDPYTRYFSPDDAESFMTSLGDGYEGIGAFLVQDDASGQVYITEFVEDSPASNSGLKIGDEITAIDDTTIENMLMQDVINRVKGPEGTTVKITVLRDGKTLTFSIERAEVTITLESAEIIEDNIWYINLDAFANNMYYRFMDLIDNLEDQVEEPRAIVIDLRGNGGGYLNSANFVAGQFVPHLVPLIQLDYGSFTETIYNGDVGEYYEIPTYIFVDQFTASASEILAGTLQEEGNAIIIGTQTFGKGTTQQVVTYWDGSIIKFTMAHWLTSQGNSVNEIGITPDILIEDDEDPDTDLWLEELVDQL